MSRQRTRIDSNCTIQARNEKTGVVKTWSRDGFTTTIDTVTPGFYSLLKESRRDARKVLPVNAFSSERRFDIAVPTAVSIASQSRADGYALNAFGLLSRGDGSGHLTVGVSQPSVDIDGLTTQAVASSREPVWDAATFTMELLPTARMFYRLWETFYDTLKRLWDQFLREKKRDRGGNLRTLWEEFARWWLTYRYGLAPFYADILSIDKAARLLAQKGNEAVLQRGNANGRERVTASKVKQTQSWVVCTPTANVASLGAGTVYITNTVTTVERVTSVRVTAGTVFEKDNGVIGRDPFVTAYELITLSFVLDWFIDFGSWIQSWAPTVKGELAFVSVTSQLETLTTTTAFAQATRANGNHVASGGTSSFTTGFMQTVRTPYSYTGAVPVPIDLNWKRVTDIVALAIALKFGKSFADNLTN